MHLLAFVSKLALIVAETWGSQKPDSQADSGPVELPETSSIYIQKKTVFAMLAHKYLIVVKFISVNKNIWMDWILFYSNGYYFKLLFESNNYVNNPLFYRIYVVPRLSNVVLFLLIEWIGNHHSRR